jgi:hypothetical protein
MQGIASLRGYQQGGITSPDPEEERRRRLWQMMAEQRDARAHTISLRPDTLMGRDRSNMMYHLNLHGDTTGFTQQGVQDWFQSGELEEGAELVRQLRERTQARDPVTEETRGIGIHGSTDEGYPSVLSFGRPGGNVAGSYNIQGTDEISLNIPPAFEPAYARGKSNPDPLESGWRGDLERGMRVVRGGRTPQYTEEGWEQTPEDFLRRAYGHELGHAALYREPGNVFAGGGWGMEMQEATADNFSAVLEALRNATPSDSKRDVLREADRLIYDYPSGYTKGDISRRDGFSDSSGEFSDPLVVDPRAKRTRRDMFGGSTKWLVEAMLDTEQFADHPLNRGFLEKLSDRVRGGIGSLRR